MKTAQLTCPDCGGEGAKELRCGSCNGSGEGMWDGARCSSCRGMGEFREYCETCDGDGTVDEPDEEESEE